MIFMYVWCMYDTYACMYDKHACIVCMICVYLCMICMYLCIHACFLVWYACIYACMICVHVCMCDMCDMHACYACIMFSITWREGWTLLSLRKHCSQPTYSRIYKYTYVWTICARLYICVDACVVHVCGHGLKCAHMYMHLYVYVHIHVSSMCVLV